jgi:hypothetical protein
LGLEKKFLSRHISVLSSDRQYNAVRWAVQSNAVPWQQAAGSGPVITFKRKWKQNQYNLFGAQVLEDAPF